MNTIIINYINDNFISDLAKDYIMECFKFTYKDTAGSISSLIDINIDSPKKGVICFSNNIRDAINMLEMNFYYRNSLGTMDLAFSINDLSNLFEFNSQLNNRLFINLYEFTDVINCKFKFFNTQSYVFRHMHKKDFVPFTFDNLSIKFSDTLSFTETYLTEINNKVPLELRNNIKILPNNLVISYNNKFLKNETNNNINTISIFDNQELSLIPNIEYQRKNNYNNEEYIIMSNINIPILGEPIVELNYQDSRQSFILLSTGLEGGLNPTRELKAIKVDNFVNEFKNVITIWDNSQNYIIGDIVKSANTNSLYKCVLNNTNKNPVYRDNNGIVVNRDAGKYWILYDNIPIGSELTLHCNKISRNNLINKYCDSYIFIDSTINPLDSTFPNSWDYINNIISSSFDLVTININGTNESRYRSKLYNEEGRYNRLITKEDAKNNALTKRASENKLHSHGYSRALGGTRVDDRGDGANSVEFSAGTTDASGGERARGDEVDKYYLVKVR